MAKWSYIGGFLLGILPNILFNYFRKNIKDNLDSNIASIHLLKDGSRVVVKNMRNKETTYNIAMFKPPLDEHLEQMKKMGPIHLEKMKQFFPVFIIPEGGFRI